MILEITMSLQVSKRGVRNNSVRLEASRWEDLPRKLPYCRAGPRPVTFSAIVRLQDMSAVTSYHIMPRACIII